jgi:hypothetical protein
MRTPRRRDKNNNSAAPPRTRGHIPQTGPRVRWSGFRPFVDYWGNELRRYYQLETLASATERRLVSGDRFILPSVQQVLGPAPVNTLDFTLFQEGEHQLIFRLRAGNIRRKTATFGYVVAKNAEEHGKVAQAEHFNLGMLYARAKRHVVRPFLGGTVFLPGRRGKEGREVYAYLTQWLGNYHELGVNKDLQFFLNTAQPHTLSLAQTEEIKGMIVETMAATYDAKQGDAMALPEIASGDFVVTHPGKGPLKVKLIACRRILRKLTPAKYLDTILRASWDWGGRQLTLVPADPATLAGALQRARGKAEGLQWVRQYLAAVHAGAIRRTEPAYTEALADWAR